MSIPDTMTPDGSETVAYLGEEVRLRGVIAFDGTVRIDGCLEGEIRSDGTVVIGERATVHGNVYARTVVFQGRVTGDLVAREALVLLSPARVEGSIHTPTLMMEEGVTFTGTSLMGPVTEESDQTPPVRRALTAASF